MQMNVQLTQSCLTLCDPMAYTVHGILQARILKWVASPFTGGTSHPKDWTQVSCIAGEFFTNASPKQIISHAHPLKFLDNGNIN